MGIKGLTQLIGDACPEALKESDVKHYFGRKIAIDASMALYAFLISIRPEAGAWLTDESGETTSHLMGIWSRTLRFLSHGIKPVYVFDGQAPELKGDELQKRAAKKRAAEQSLKEASELGDMIATHRLEKRTVRVTPKHNDECKKLLRLMGMPVVEAPAEAEAQCAELCRAGKVYATATEDMDALTFATPILLRHLNHAEAQKKPILEIDLRRVLDGLGLTMAQFVDVCVLAGCDYCATIRGIGPKRALELIRKHGSIEAVIKQLDPAKHPLPDVFPFEAARALFTQPEVTPADEVELKWGAPDEAGLIDYLVTEKRFSEERVRKGISSLRKACGGPVQGRLDGFFVTAARPSAPSSPSLSMSQPARKKQKQKDGAAKGTGPVSKLQGKQATGAKTPSTAGKRKR